MGSSRRLAPTTTGVILRDLGKSLVPLARNLASIHLPLIRPKNPVFVTWALTEACNLACEHCTMNRPLPDELDHAQRQLTARRIAESEAWGVSLSGGEALLVEHAFDYAQTLKDAGKRVFLCTSGDRLGRFVDRVLDVGLDVLTISIDGPDAESHDKFRHRTGLFGRVVEAVEQIAARRRADTPRLQVRCTINRRNFRELQGVIDFWKDRVDNVILQIVQESSLHQIRDRGCLFQPEDREEFERVFAELRARHPFLTGPYYDLMSRFVFEPEALYTDIGFRCLLVPATSIIVEANGKVKLCHGRPDSEIGNILDADLETIWRGYKASQARTSMQSKEYNCMCWEASYARNLDLVEMSRHYETLTSKLRPLVGGAPA